MIDGSMDRISRVIEIPAVLDDCLQQMIENSGTSQNDVICTMITRYLRDQKLLSRIGRDHG